jgi:hypothetical protein
MGRSKFRNPSRCTFFVAGLLSLVNLTIIFYWSLEQPTRQQLLKYFSLQHQENSEAHDQVYVSNVLDIAYRPWEDDPDCREYTVGFIRNGSRPMMALMSYPGSGNTWIRGIIERLSGYFTGSIYADKDLYVKGSITFPVKFTTENVQIKSCRIGFYGEVVPIDCGCTIVQKTHDFQKNDYKPFVNKSAILIIRNPYGALVSYRNFMTTGYSHTASASPTQFTGISWKKFVTKEIDRWKTKALEWIPKIGHGGILLYEDLKKEKRNQFRNLMRYLGLEVDERRLDCVIKHDFSSFKRNSTRSTTNETIRYYNSKIFKEF